MYALRVAFAAAAVAAIACVAAGAYPSTLKLKLYAQNRPGETGTVTLEQIPAVLRPSSKWPAVKTARSPFISTQAPVRS